MYAPDGEFEVMYPVVDGEEDWYAVEAVLPVRWARVVGEDL